MSEFGDEYSEALGSELRKLEEALLGDQVKLLAPSEPIRLSPTTTVEAAVAKMVDDRRAAVVVIDDGGRLIGIFTERDVLTRVVRKGRDAHRTLLSEVMTPEPESLAPQDRICHAINRMHMAGHRSIPLLDTDDRPVGIITVTDIVKWLAELFPEAVLNLRPGDKLKHPHQMDSG